MNAVSSPPVLPPPARYFPPRNGRYEVAANLRPLETDFGNGPADRLAFQLDWRFPEFRANTLRCRAERLPKYCGQHGLPDPVREAVAAFLVRRLSGEHPGCFRWDAEEGTLHCRLTGEVLRFGAGMRLVVGEHSPVHPPYLNAFDALCSQVQEDVAVVCTGEGRPDWLAAYHVCAPSDWSPEEKVGRDFVSIHSPVPHVERLNRAARSLVEGMVHRPPTVRFVWGIETDSHLNRHPEPPPGISREEWRGLRFDPDAPAPFVVRVERQVMWGLPDVGAALFLIRLHHLPAEELRPEERAQLAAAIRGMDPESRAYKGFGAYAEALVSWLTC